MQNYSTNIDWLDSLIGNKATYDFGIKPAYMESWSCFQWIQYHKFLVAKFKNPLDVQRAFLNDYGRQNTFSDAYSWCKYDKDFIAYFKKQGLDFSKPWSDIIIGVGGVVTSGGQVLNDLGQVIGDVGSSVTGVSKTVKILTNPFVLIGGGVLAYILWIEYKKDKKRN